MLPLLDLNGAEITSKIATASLIFATFLFAKELRQPLTSVGSPITKGKRMNPRIDVRQFKSSVNAKMKLNQGAVSLRTINIEKNAAYNVLAAQQRTELTYIIPVINGRQSTRACFETDDGTTDIADLGPLVLRPAGMMLRAFGYASDQSVTRTLMCQFDNEYFADVTGLREWSEETLVRCGNLQSKSIALLMQRIAHELHTTQFRTNIAVESLTNLILVELGRTFLPRELKTTSLRRLAPWQLRKIEQHLCEVENQWPSLTELAALCGVSTKYLSRTFSETTGTPLSVFAEQIRMERAKKLLIHARLPVKQVAAALGFSNANYFSTAFHRATGETPRNFVFGAEIE